MVYNKKLEVIKLSKRIKKKCIIKNISFICERGERIALLGPNGAGKTTTFLTVSGFYKPDSGEIILDGEDITYLPAHKKAQKGIVYLPQERSFFDELTVRENFEIACELAKIPKEKIQQTAEKFGITHLLRRKSGTLSGGERRKSEIARVCLLSPKFLILDEPFAGIDPKSISTISNLIKKMSDEDGIGIIISDHNVRDTIKICHRIYLIYDGKIALSGTPKEVVGSELAKSVFFGDSFEL